jgi:tetratricopeptide (TPR) repeat protein
VTVRSALTCPVCGAPREPGFDQCAYCGSWLVVFPDAAEVVPLDEAVIRERIAIFRKALARDPDDSVALHGIGVAFRSLGLLDDATRALARAANRRPESLSIQRALAGTLLDVVRRYPHEPRMWRDVSRQAERILALDPEAVEGWRLLAEAAMRTHDIDALIDVAPGLARYDREGDHRDVARRLLDLGEKRYRDWRWRGAVEAWAALAAVDPRAGRTALVAFLLENSRLVPRSTGPVWRAVRQTMALRGDFRLSALASIAFGLALAIIIAMIVYLTDRDLFPPVAAVGIVLIPLLSLVAVRWWLAGWPPFPVPRRPWREIPTRDIVAVARRVAPAIDRIRPTVSQ